MRPTGRTRHAHKITVYLSDDELAALDRTLNAVRTITGRKVDRGRYVREALAMSSLHKIASRIRREGT